MKKLPVFIILIAFCCSAKGLRSYDVDKEKNLVTYRTDGDVNMILLGDWGGMPTPPYASPFEEVTALQIMREAKLQNSDFVVALGDNFYFNGVTDEYDKRFQTTFERVFSNEEFQSVPWFVVGGNHDHYGNITGQVEYSKHSKRWNFPSLWYTIKVKTPKFNATIVMIDTVMLCGNTDDDHVADQPDPETRDQWNAVDQITYIEDQLKNNKDDYVFVAGHFPVWSVAEHGPTQCLLDHLKPMLQKYKVSAYMCGHDHNLQHINDDGVEYFVSGAGDMINPRLDHLDSIPDGSLKFHSANFLSMGGFATLHLDKDSAKLVFESGMGSSLYQYSFNNRL